MNSSVNRESTCALRGRDECYWGGLKSKKPEKTFERMQAIRPILPRAREVTDVYLSLSGAIKWTDSDDWRGWVDEHRLVMVIYHAVVSTELGNYTRLLLKILNYP